MKYLALLFLLVFTGCSVKNYEVTKTKLIIIKSSKIKFADIGYIRNTNKEIEVELFIAGNPIEKITINTFICVSAGCMSKSGFNEGYLHKSYPTEILQNILLGNVIYNAKNKVQTKDGFEQTIKTDEVNIKYRVDSKTIYFKDKTNNILFKIKDIQ